MHRTFRLHRCLPMMAWLSWATVGHAQSTSARPLQEAQFDPSDVYFQGYLATRDAEKFEQAGDSKSALEKLERARQMFDTIEKYYPDWKPDMVKRRSSSTDEALARVRPLALQAKSKDAGVIAELEGGIRRPISPKPSGRPEKFAVPDPVPSPPSPQPNILQVDPLALKRLREAEAERDRLKQLLAEQTSRARLNEQARIDAEAKHRQDAGARAQMRKQVEQIQMQAEELRRKAAAERVAMQQELQQEVDRMRAEAAAKEKKLQQDLELLRMAATEKDEGRNQQDTEAEIRLEAERIARQREVEEEVRKIREEAALKEQKLSEQLVRMRAEASAKELEMRNEKEKLLAEAESLRARATGQDELVTQNRELIDKVNAAENQVHALRSRLAAAPMQSELDGLNQRLEALDQERRALDTALNQSRVEYDGAMARIKTLEADLQVSRQKSADIRRNLEVEKNLANEVVAGQRRQLNALQKQLAEKDVALRKANETIANLTRELRESRETVADLQQERDALLLERDQMSALLKLNESGRVQELIEQNMALARDLRMANEKVERLYSDNNGDKDRLIDAKRNLAIAKARITRLQDEKKAQDQRIAELEEKLRAEESALAEGTASSDPAEVEMLREIISRQLRVQARRKQARDILLDAARKLGKQDEELAGAIDLLDAQEVELSPEEMKLLADKPVDSEFLSPYARDRVTVERAMDQQRSEITAYERAAEKSFLAERYLSTREIYETILEQNPGHTPSLCRIGVVHLKLKDPSSAADMFQRATELDQGNSYAHRMLGYSLMLLGDLHGAENAARRAVDLAPDDAKSQTLLAALCDASGRSDEAESHFKDAISVDPMMSEPYINLAWIYFRDKETEKARDYYRQALERGAVPDPKLEDSLR